MRILSCLTASMLTLCLTASASGQIVSGLMTVTGAEMH